MCFLLWVTKKEQSPMYDRFRKSNKIYEKYRILESHFSSFIANNTLKKTR